MIEVGRPLTFHVACEAPSDKLPTCLRALERGASLSTYVAFELTSVARNAIREDCLGPTRLNDPKRLHSCLVPESCGSLVDARTFLALGSSRAPRTLFAARPGPRLVKALRWLGPASSQHRFLRSELRSRDTSDRILQPILFSFQTRAPVPCSPIESVWLRLR